MREQHVKMYGVLKRIDSNVEIVIDYIQFMSAYEYDYSSYEDSSTDEEYDKSQEEIISEQVFNSASDHFYDVMYKNNIRSPLERSHGRKYNKHVS